MSEPMAVTVKIEDGTSDGEEAAAVSATVDPGPSLEPASQLASDQPGEATSEIKDEPIEVVEHPIKRRASVAFHDEDIKDEFLGFNEDNLDDSAADYNKVLERIEAEVSEESRSFTPVRKVVATPTPTRVSKRLRQDTGTDNSRPSSALSSRSDGDGILSSTDMASSTASSPGHRAGRRPTTTDVASPLLRVPLDRGWRRELVHRAALDAHSRRNADIYYYTPNGKKLRSTREVAEHLTGTGLTLENFSFFKEPLGVEDPEKEIIRDAKMFRRVESPVGAPSPAPLEGKRTPKPKPPKGASPEPAPPVSPQATKIKVKLTGSRLSGPAGAKRSSPAPPGPPAAPAAAPASADNNNSAGWKKPRPNPPQGAADRPNPPHGAAVADRPNQPQEAADRPDPPHRAADRPNGVADIPNPPQRAAERANPPHSAAAVDRPTPLPHAPAPQNCEKSSSPPPQHKSAAPRRPVLLTMKVSGSDAGGQRVWSVSRPTAPTAAIAPIAPIAPTAPIAPAAARALALRPTLPQSLAVINGRRFIVVPRSIATPQHDARPKGRLANGSAPAPAPSPRRRGRARADDTDYFTDFCSKSQAQNYSCVIQIFQYLGMRDLAHCARVCRLWRTLAATPALWRHVRMKNSHVSDWAGLCAALQQHGTARLDLRKMLLPQHDAAFWEAFARHLPAVRSLERIEMCRCPASAVEAVCRGLPGLRSLSALAVRDARLDPTPLAALQQLSELRLKSMAGLSLARDLQPLAALQRLQHLSLTSIKELGCCSCEIVGSLKQLVSLELGECTFRASFGAVLATLPRLQRLRLERGTADCAAPALLRALATLPALHQLELVNFDVKVGFDDALAECKNIQRLLIIPTYVSQSATTNKQVLSGVLRLKDTLTHLMWGVTIELLRVTELFIDQCDQGGDSKKKDIGECIPVLKPVPGCRLPEEHHHVAGPPQVEILPLPTLQRLLSAQLPTTKLKLLRIPFHATWRQSLADFQ